MANDPPQVLLKSKLRLTRAQEKRLMEHCMQRRTGIRTEMGFNDSTATAGIGYVGQTTVSWRGMALTGWALKRWEAHQMYENDFSFRALQTNTGRFGTLYKIFNTSMNVPQRAVNVYKARACEALVNTSPFCGFMPEGQDDDATPIKNGERLFNSKLDDCEARFHFREGITQACLSEAVMKTALIPVIAEPEVDEDAQIWLDAQGQPMRDEMGGYVFCDEELDYHPDILEVRVLKRDPSVILDGTETQSDPQPIVRNGSVSFKLDVRPTGWENFFCSPLEADIHDADCCFHEFDEEYDMLLRRTQNAVLSKPARAWLKDMKDMAPRYPQAEGGQPHFNRGERDVEMYGPGKIHICEQWIRFDVQQRGQADELCVVWAVGNNGTEAWPIYYDLMKDASPTSKRPFEVIRVIPVRDRWYGMGFYDLLSNDHEFIDDCWNRIRARSSASGRMDWFRRDAFEGLEYGGVASLSGGKPFVLKTDMKGPGTEHIGSIPFPEMDEKIWEMLKMAMQVAQLRSGTMTASDAAISDLASNRTATGQDMLANESELMSGDTTQDVIRGLVATLKQCIIATFETPDEDSKKALQEYANLLLGVKDGMLLIEWLQTHKPKNFSKHVRLLLTKARSKQAMQAAIQLNQFVTGGMSWVQINQQYPQWAEQFEPLFIDIGNSLDYPNMKALLQVPDEIKQMALAQQQVTAQQSAQLPVKQTGTTDVPQPVRPLG